MPLVFVTIDAEKSRSKAEQRALALRRMLSWMERAAQVALAVHLVRTGDDLIQIGAVTQHRTGTVRPLRDVPCPSALHQRHHATVRLKQPGGVSQ
jgi:hypothetical protein